ncbi:MAG: CDP-glycerol glycerophosphotransferase family protein [Lachnospiraceae bacterium]|nr:CDP-glycerol glycerophosphotransferase family protein [Lachnospiraceae bacterium]
MNRLLLYIDPGTGSMLFAAMLGIVSTVYFLLQQLWLKIKYRGGKVAVDADKKELVIFGEGGQYWKVFKPICDELEKRGMSCEYYTMDEKDGALSADYKHIKVQFIGSDNRAFAKLNLMKAHVCLATTPGLGVYQWKRSRGVDKYVHIYHDASEGTGYRMFGLDDYDAVLMNGSFQEGYIRRLEEMREEDPKELVLVGCTYLDTLLARKEKEGSVKKNDKLTVLLAPSWGQSAIFSRFGDKIIEALLKTGYHIIVRPHPQTFKSEAKIIEPIMEKYPGNEQLEWDRSHDNFDSLNRADVMITDFSSVMFDYSFVFDKPIIYANKDFDKSPYDSAWFEDDEIWHITVISDLGVELREDEFDNMKKVIDDIVKDDKYAAGRRKARDTAWQNIGGAAKAVVDYLESLKEEEQPEEEAEKSDKKADKKKAEKKKEAEEPAEAKE